MLLRNQSVKETTGVFVCEDEAGVFILQHAGHGGCYQRESLSVSADRYLESYLSAKNSSYLRLGAITVREVDWRTLVLRVRNIVWLK
jgi:hypothetical protein